VRQDKPGRRGSHVAAETSESDPTGDRDLEALVICAKAVSLRRNWVSNGELSGDAEDARIRELPPAAWLADQPTATATATELPTPLDDVVAAAA
jgi:hypothetical protein